MPGSPSYLLLLSAIFELLMGLGDLRRYGAILQLCFAIVVLGGIGRALALIQVGQPASGIGPAFITVALVIELVLMPLAWLTFRRASLAAEQTGMTR